MKRFTIWTNLEVSRRRVISCISQVFDDNMRISNIGLKLGGDEYYYETDYKKKEKKRHYMNQC